MKKLEILTQLNEGKLTPLFEELYGPEDLDHQFLRWLSLVEKHTALYGDQDIRLFSTPGRTELGGNHTDHNRGRVLAGSINLDTIAAVSLTGDSIVIIDSEGYPPVRVDISDLSVHKEEEGRTEALVRGIAARFKARGYALGGFNTNTSSSVLKGSGLSSSAALEVLVGTIFSTIFNDNAVTSTEIAQIGQFAENNYFGKPCGLMDQVACAHGGIVAIDFKDPGKPVISPVVFNFQKAGYSLMVVDTGGNHADLTPEYAAIPAEMRSVAAFFGKEVCRDVDEERVLESIAELRQKTGDRAILRALHFYNDNKRVSSMLEALKDNKAEEYLRQVNRSGHSSFCYLQNVYPGKEPREQGISLALALTEEFLDGKGACRVHGGGFAGTIQVYIPNEMAAAYENYMTGFFGKGSVTPLKIRSLSSMEILS
ncbi:galactokinase family protein [Oceanispirochaeta sp.]|jgi:galactokinase|uniref:galactokinase n=1 Tax=Oceanispirochaeta sp. TaxID=2035350 RepID=UPI002626C199|nr:galactokinase family protein [Oceanispirochaeta sp.]MDA3955684.1 galactokinase [Oceanispirochaeta sp.]